MPVISSTLYKQIADTIDSVQYRNVDILDLFDTLAEDINNSEVDSENVDKDWLYNSLINNRTVFFNDHYTFNYMTKNFVKALQQHVVDNYGNLNNYLLDNNIQVFFFSYFALQ